MSGRGERYDKGFVGPSGRDQSTRHDRGATPASGRDAADQRRTVGTHGPPERGGTRLPAATRAPAIAGAAHAPEARVGTIARRRTRWSTYSGRFGLGCGAIGAAIGLLSLVLTGNVAAIPVLALFMGLGGAFVFWLVASVLDVFRRV